MKAVRQQFIVAEISKNWIDGLSVSGDARPIGAVFEVVIGNNLANGYVLHQFQLHQMMTGPTSLMETIIAVFKLNEE